ncbi:hypothetical protein [Cellulophaga baltica]|uniref:hypothetical protein n=1 Tax=Cellulophaga baltica TaxID=76594 RepID=UPI0024953B98|nr:hypothetical protein [Cellulophaga baltica]
MRVLLTLIFFLTIGIHTAKACKCQGVNDVQTEFEGTEVIVHAKVLSKSIVSYASTLSTDKINAIREKYKSDSQKLAFLESESIIKVELEIIESYKGNDLKNKITVYTSRTGASCGFLAFKVDEDFLIYLSQKSQMEFMFAKASDGTKDGLGLWTNNCTRTKGFDKSEHEKLCKLKNG